MKLKNPLGKFLLLLIVVLIFAGGNLLRKTIHYKQENRKLILQNDSLQAVVIDLNKPVPDNKYHDSSNIITRRKGDYIIK